MHWHEVHGHAIDARPRDDVPKVWIKDRKFLFHTSECRGKRIQLLSSCDAINLHACLKRPRDHDLAICIYMQGRYIRDQENHTGGTADVDWCRGYTPSDPDGDLDVVEDLRCPPMSLCNYIWHLYAIVSDLVLDRVSIKDESRSDRCSPIGTKSMAIDKFKCNQGRPCCNKSDTIAMTTTASATTKFHGNTYMILHLEARKEAIAPHLLQQRIKKFATQIRRCYIAV